MTRATAIYPGYPGPWFPQLCKVNGFAVYRLERQTGPCARDDYEFARDEDGRIFEFRESADAAEAADKLNDRNA